MNSKYDSQLVIKPVESYNTPQIPTMEETRNNPQMLKKLPSRWQKNRKILLCAGLAGTLSLSSCINFANINYSDVLNIEPTQQQSAHREYELQVTLHGGGGGSFSYVVHLTEQEAFNIIQTQLEAAGLNFNDIPPDYVVDSGGWGPEFSLELFDKEKGVAISHISWEDNNTPFFSHGGIRLSLDIAEGFRQQAASSDRNEDIIFGVFYNTSWHPPFVRDPEIDDWWSPVTPSTETVNAGRPILEMRMAAQAQLFIDILQSQGILQPTREINVVLDGTPVEFRTSVFTFNNRTIVSLREMLVALGMSFEWGGGWQAATATKDGLEIVIDHSRQNITVNGESIDYVFPVTLHNVTILVQLEYLVELIGANMEWDSATHTVTITTS